MMEMCPGRRTMKVGMKCIYDSHDTCSSNICIVIPRQLILVSFAPKKILLQIKPVSLEINSERREKKNQKAMAI